MNTIGSFIAAIVGMIMSLLPHSAVAPIVTTDNTGTTDISSMQPTRETKDAVKTGPTNKVIVDPSTQKNTNPQIQLTSPIGGEEFFTGSTVQVNWSTSGLPTDIASRHPRIGFLLSDFDSSGNYGTYTGSHKQDNGVAFGGGSSDIATILKGSAQIPVTLHYTSPNKFARGFLQITLSYDREKNVQQPATAILATGPISAYVDVYSSTKSEITISFPNSTTGNPCFDDYQSWNLGGTWFADGARRTSTCLVGGPGSGTVDFNCQRPNICSNGQWYSGQ